MATTNLRTPDDAFARLPDFAFEPQYRDDLTEIGARIAYLDEGPRDGRVYLCLHGQPTWSYLYRKMIPVFTAAGGRVVAPDLLGFGRSDKPADASSYTFLSHRAVVLALVRALDLRDVTLVVQDWGGLLGLTLPLDEPERYTRLIAMNTALGTGDVPLGPGFLAWRAYCAANPDLDVAALMKRSVRGLTDDEAAAYAAPFPDVSFKAGVRAFPQLVPDAPESPGAALSREARTFWQSRWAGASFLAIGMQDPVLGPPAMRALAASIRNSPPPLELAEAGHFVQESGRTVAEAALAHFG